MLTRLVVIISQCTQILNHYAIYTPETNIICYVNYASIYIKNLKMTHSYSLFLGELLCNRTASKNIITDPRGIVRAVIVNDDLPSISNNNVFD